MTTIDYPVGPADTVRIPAFSLEGWAVRLGTALARWGAARSRRLDAASARVSADDRRILEAVQDQALRVRPLR